jgi:phospholipid-binding lipoprotein MlaA
VRGHVLLALGCGFFCLVGLAHPSVGLASLSDPSTTLDDSAGECSGPVATNEDGEDGGGSVREVDRPAAVEDSAAREDNALADAAPTEQDEIWVDPASAPEPGEVMADPASVAGQSELGVDPPSAVGLTSLAQTADQPGRDELSDEPFEEYDPWIRFNEKTFDFNYWFDRRVLKPVAKAYDTVVPDPIQLSIRNAFENVGAIRRILNALLQGRFRVAGGELGRFLFNSVVGVGGLFDVAKSELGLEQTDADTGQTFGVWGAGPGPYLVVPLLPPLTVRDAFGFVIDALMNPITWFAPTPASIGLTAERVVNERSLNLEAFENVEETVLDLYSAVRNGYLQRRSSLIEEGRADSVFFGR